MKRINRISIRVLLFLCASILFVQAQENPQKSVHSKISDELAIKAVVYSDLLGKPNKEAAKLGGACFLEASYEEKAYLQSLFAGRQPRVEAGDTNNIIITKTNIIDRLTGKPAALFWAKVKSQTNNTAQAVGGRYLTSMAGVEYNYQLTFDGTNWIIRNKKQGVIW